MSQGKYGQRVEQELKDVLPRSIAETLLHNGTKSLAESRIRTIGRDSY